MNNLLPYYFKIIKITSTFLLGLILLFSCTDSKKAATFIERDLADFIVDTLYLEKDTLTRSLPDEFTYLEQNGKRYLFGYSRLRLYQYEYTTGKLLKTVYFDREGPDGIGSFVSGSLITEDGIFFISDQKHIVHTGFDGKVLGRYPLPEVPEERLAVNFSAVNGNKMSYDKEKKQLILADVPFVLKEPNMGYENWVWRYDLGKRSAEPIPFKYPEIYRQHYDDPELGIYSHTFLDFKNLHVVSFPVTDSLLVIDGKSAKWVGSKSATALIFKKGTTVQQGEYMVFSPSMETSRYKWTLLEPNSQLLFRYVDIQTKVIEEGEIVNRSSFILHNLDFETIGELFFDNRQITPSGFATPNGYFFKLLNPDSDDSEAYIKVGLNF
jgi:hypothetical protein